MANYSLVVNSVYNPFTFDELVKPYQIYGQAYKEQEEKYNQLAEDSAKWGDQLKPDSEAYKMWNEFQGNVSDAATQLITKGLTPATRGAMSQVRQSYGRNIKSIEAADVEYKKALALRDQVKGNDDSVRYKKDISLDDYLHGKKGSTEHLSGTKLRTETADMAEKLGTAIFSNPNFTKAMGDYYYQIGVQKGAPVAMLAYIQDPYKMAGLEAAATKENADANDVKLYNNMKAFADLYNTQISRTNGYSTEDRTELNNQIYQGMYSGLAKPAYDYQRNLGKMTASEVAADQRARDQHNDSMRANGFVPDGHGGWKYDPNSDPDVAKTRAVYGAKHPGGGSGSTTRSNRLSAPVKISSDGGTAYYEKAADIPSGAVLVTDLSKLPDKQKQIAKAIVGDDLDSGYDYYLYDDGMWSGAPDNDGTDDIIIVPRRTTVVGANGDGDDDY